MNTVDEIFEEFGGPTSLARAIGINVSTASEMRRRASIPVEYWPRLIEAARARGLAGLDAERLMDIHSSQSPPVAPNTSSPSNRERAS